MSVPNNTYGYYPNQPPQLPPAPPPSKKPWYKRWWAIAIFVLVGLSVLSSMFGGDNDAPATTPEPTPSVTTQAPSPDQTTAVTTPAAPETTVEQVPAEHKAALRSAKNYLSFMPFCKARLFDQLTSEYGDKFPADAAQYAVDNVEADWNQQALKLAINYRQTMGMSDSGIWDQLTSPYGEQCLPEQADFAIANLPT